jgi:hypothetical protein
MKKVKKKPFIAMMVQFFRTREFVSVKMNKKAVITNTDELVYNDHPRAPKVVPPIVRWSLFRGNL